MNKQIIYKYLSGQATEEEQTLLLEWASKSEKNEKYLIGQMNLWVSQHIPEGRADVKGYERLKVNIMERQKVRRKKPRTNLIWGMAAAIIFLIFLNIWQYKYYKPNNESEKQLAEVITYENYIPVNEIYTVKGTKAKIILPDSSLVWLNSDSKISYPDSFGVNTREIKFTGEAYFDVVANPDRPMLIKDNMGHEFKVLGTKFNIKSYENDSHMELTLYSGKVQVFGVKPNKTSLITEIKNSKILTLGVGNSISKSGLTHPTQNSEWKDGQLVFNETPMSEVIRMLERWHGVSIKVADPDILDYKFTARFESESIVQILDFVKMTTFIDYTVQGNKVVLKKR